MNDKQQLAAMGEHMREMEECNQQKHSAAQVIAWAGDYEKIGGHGLIVEMLKSYAGMLDSYQSKPEFKVPDGWSLAPNMPTPEMCAAFHRADADWEDGWAFDDNGNRHDSPVYQWAAMLAAAPEYKP